jgi:hypothetical protein
LWLHEIKHESRFGDKPSKEMSVLMRRKEVERRSRKYAAVQNVSVIGWYTDAEEFHQKYKTRRAVDKKHMSSSSPEGKNRIMIFGPNPDGTYVVEFRTATGETLAISVPSGETRVLKHFQERMPYGLFVPELDRRVS